jgi:hypothetical protein
MASVRNYYWVARDRDGGLKLFDGEPLRMGDFFVQKWSFDEVWNLPEDLFITVTWENSPKMVCFEI